MRRLGFVMCVVVFGLGCGSVGSSDDCDDDRICPECLTGTTTCEFAGETATEAGCNGCQARVALLDRLCSMGVDAELDEFECVDVED